MHVRIKCRDKTIEEDAAHLQNLSKCTFVSSFQKKFFFSVLSLCVSKQKTAKLKILRFPDILAQSFQNIFHQKPEDLTFSETVRCLMLLQSLPCYQDYFGKYEESLLKILPKFGDNIDGDEIYLADQILALSCLNYFDSDSKTTNKL